MGLGPKQRCSGPITKISEVVYKGTLLSSNFFLRPHSKDRYAMRREMRDFAKKSLRGKQGRIIPYVVRRGQEQKKRGDAN